MKLADFQQYFPLLKGSIGETHFRCGKKNCACIHGKLHSAHYLSYRQAGKTNTIHIPNALVPEIVKLCQNWRKFNNKIEQESHKKILKLFQIDKAQKA